MGKFTAIQTYDRFTKLKNANKIEEHSLNFILDTGQLYTHGIFLNNVAWGTETTGAVELTIAGVKKTLSLSNHTHNNYLEKNANIDLGAYKIVSGTKDLLYYSSGNTYLGNTSSPLILQGSSGSIKKGDTTYTILDTLNFTILAVSSAGHSLQNAAKITYGSSNFLIDYIKRLNTTLAFNDLNAYSSAGVTLTDSKYYAFITLRNDGSDTANWAQVRFDIASKTMQYRTSAASTIWYNVITSIPSNALNVAGIVAAPTSSDANKVWKTDALGNPGWKDDTNTLYYLTLNGTVKGTSGTNDLGTFYAIPTSNASAANQVWMRNSDNNGYAWRTLGSRAFDSTSYLPLSGGTISGGINPNSDSAINLGTQTAKYHYLYVHRLVRVQSIAKGDTYDSYKLDLPDKSGTIALTSDIPSLSNYLPLSGGTMTGNISMNNSSSITNLPINGGIYWNPYVESSSDGSDAASITLVSSGPAGGTTLVLTQQNDSNDTIQFVTNGSANLYHNSNKIWDAGNDGSGSGLDADTVDGLHVHTGRNYEANKIVCTDSYGYIQCGYINSSSGDENNNSSPARVWGTNGSDSYLRTYRTSALSVGYANSAGYADSAGSVTWSNVSSKPFTGTTFNSGDNSNHTHDCNEAWQNGTYYYYSNGPSGLGESTSDGALYVQNYSSSWVGQIAQDYRNGHLFVRGKNSGTWLAWKRIIDSDNISSQSVSYASSAGSVAWGNVTSKPGSTGSGTQPVYWNGSTFVACTAYGSATVSNSDMVDGYHYNNLPYHPINGSWKPSSLSSYTRHWGWAYSSAEAGLASNGSEMQIYTDGKFWQREGAYYCLDNGNTYVSSGTGVINGTTITQVSNADTVDSQHFSYSNSSNSPTWIWGTNSSGTSFLASRANLSVNYANSAGNADTVDSEHASSFAHRQIWNNMIHSGNEYTWIADGYSGGVWINYRTASGSCDGNITEYIFGNGKGGSLASITSGTFNGNCTGSAGSVAWGNISGKPFNWSGQSGQPSWLWGSNDGSNYYVWNPSNFSVNYANRAAYLDGHGVNPNNSHPGYGARVFYSWNTGQAGNDSAGYSNGITIGSHPSDQSYGFQIVQNMWDDRTYTRRYNGGWQEWKTLAWTSDIPSTISWDNVTSKPTLLGAINYNNDSNSTYLMLWGSGNAVYGTGGIYCNPYTDYLYSGSFYCSNWFRSSGLTGWYNESYGGGWYMSDANWLRSYNSKGVVASGFYHSSYGSSAYALTSDGGVAHIGSMSVNYANSAGSVSWDNVSSKPGLVGSSSTPVYWTGSGFGECSVQDSRIITRTLSTGQKWAFQYSRAYMICLIISVPYWNYGRILLAADGTYGDEGGYITIGEQLSNYCRTRVTFQYGYCEIAYTEDIYNSHLCNIMVITDGNWWRDFGIS